jgi:hypothetical protein
MLMKVDELAPVFGKLGIQGVSDLLKREMKGKTCEYCPTSGAQKWRGINFNDMRRTFTLQVHRDASPTKGEVPDDYKLPTLQVHEGALLLDNELVPRIAFDNKSNTIRWSRDLGYTWEHGYTELSQYGLDGIGVIALSDEENLSKNPTDGEVVIPFIMSKANLINDKGDETNALNHKAVANVPVATVPKTVAAKTQSLMAISSVAKPAAALAAVLPPTADEGIIDGEDYWDVVVDNLPWDKGVVKTAATNPTALGKLALATYHTVAGTKGMKIPVIVFPLLEQLRKDINATKTADTSIGPLYKTVVTTNKSGFLAGQVTVHRASYLASIADQAPTDLEAPMVIKNLTFKGVGSNVVIPILFSYCEFDFSWDYTKISGALYEHNVEMTGNLGQRYAPHL